MIEWVASSASCSASAMRLPISLRVGRSAPSISPEQVGTGDEMDRLSGEEVEERGVARGEAQAHSGLRETGWEEGDQRGRAGSG